MFSIQIIYISHCHIFILVTSLQYLRLTTDITHIEKLKTQLSEFFEKYQKYSTFLYALHSHFRKTMLRNHFDILFRKKLKKLTRRFEHIEIFFDERKIRDSDSNKIRKSRFFYRQSNVDNVNKNDDVQNAIDRNESKN